MNNIDIQYKNITAVLSKELAVYETIIDLFRQKQECILKGNIDNLKSIVEEIQASSTPVSYTHLTLPTNTVV